MWTSRRRCKRKLPLKRKRFVAISKNVRRGQSPLASEVVFPTCFRPEIEPLIHYINYALLNRKQKYARARIFVGLVEA